MELLQDLRARLTPTQYLAVHLFLGLIICVAALLLFALVARGVIDNGSLVQLDQNVATATHSWITEDATDFFKAITLLGLQGVWLVFAAVAVYCADRRRWGHLITWLSGFAGAQILDYVLKLVFNRPRPVFTDPVLIAANSSFPSGHAMVSLVVYGLLATFILLQVRNHTVRIGIIVVTILLILLIGFSRIYLGVHYFSDVFGGYVVGVVWLTICISGLNIIESRKLRRA